MGRQPQAGTAGLRLALSPLAGGRNEDVAQPELAATGQRRRPPQIDGEVRLGVRRDYAEQHLGDDPASHLSETIAALAHVRLAQHVEPERSLVCPAVTGKADLVRGQRVRADMASDGLPGRQSGPLATLEVSRGERAVRLLFDGPGDLAWQLDQRARQLPVYRLRPLGGRAAGNVEQERP